MKTLVLQDRSIEQIKGHVGGFANDICVEGSQMLSDASYRAINGDYGAAADIVVKIADRIEVLLWVLYALESLNRQEKIEKDPAENA